jgi:hypothetical protein
MLGDMYAASGNSAKAQKDWEEAKKMYEKVLGPHAAEIKVVQDLLDGKRPATQEQQEEERLLPIDGKVPEL